MAHRLKYRLQSSRNKRGGGFFLVFLVLACGIVLWIWQANKMHDPKNRGLFTITARAQTNTPTLTTLTATPTRTNAASPISTNQSKPTVLQRTNTPVAPSPAFPRPPKDVLEAQVALMRHGISPGSIDGVNGSQTRAALVAFQKSALLTMTGELDATTRTALVLDSPPFTNHIVTSNDLARLQPVSKTWLGKSQQTALDYETILELVAEQGHASPNLIKRLNPDVDWTNVVTGTEIKIPDAVYPPAKKAAFATIRLAEKQLQVFDASTNLLAHFPCSIAQRVDKRPVGELHIVAVAPNPDYTFNPEVFPESPEAQQLKTKLILPPGPNNPVGTAWISLDKPGYGMHGTPKPEDVGRTESHGCFRLANWNADFLIKMVWVGMPVYVEP